MRVLVEIQSRRKCQNVRHNMVFRATDKIPAVKEKIENNTEIKLLGKIRKIVFRGNDVEEGTLRKCGVTEGDTICCHLEDTIAPKRGCGKPQASSAPQKVPAPASPESAHRRRLRSHSAPSEATESTPQGHDVNNGKKTPPNTRGSRKSRKHKSVETSHSTTEDSASPPKRARVTLRRLSVSPVLPACRNCIEVCTVPVCNEELDGLKQNLAQINKELKKLMKCRDTLEKQLHNSKARKDHQIEKLRGELHSVQNKVTDNMDSELQCSVCNELFVQAQTLVCSHTFCEYCLCLWQREKSVCPVCRAPITAKHSTRVLDNYIDKMVETLSVEVKQKRKKLKNDRTVEMKSLVRPTRGQQRRLSTGGDSLDTFMQNTLAQMGVMVDFSEDDNSDDTWSSTSEMSTDDSLEDGAMDSLLIDDSSTSDFDLLDMF